MRTLLLVAISALTGCATNAKFQENMNRWMGQSESSLISGMWPPASVYTVSDTEKVLTYQQSGQMVLPGQTYNTPVTTTTYGQVNSRPFSAQSTTYVPQQGAPTVIGLSCTVNVTITNGWVSRWQANGNHCVSR